MRREGLERHAPRAAQLAKPGTEGGHLLCALRRVVPQARLRRDAAASAASCRRHASGVTATPHRRRRPFGRSTGCAGRPGQPIRPLA